MDIELLGEGPAAEEDATLETTLVAALSCRRRSDGCSGNGLVFGWLWGNEEEAFDLGCC